MGEYLSIMINKVISSNCDSSTFPDPNTLSLSDPYNGGNYPKGQVSPLWITQDVVAYFPTNNKTRDYADDDTMSFSIKASEPTATYSVTVWYFNHGSRIWTKPNETPTESYTGSINSRVFIDRDIPFYLEFSDPSSGTLELSIDSSKVKVL